MAKLIGRRYQYTKDYKTTPYLGPNGREERRIEYVGKWIKPLNDDAEIKRITVVSRILTAVSPILILLAFFAAGEKIENKWFILFAVVSLFPISYEIMGAFRLPTTSEKMERINFDKSFIRLRHSSVICIVMLLLSLFGAIVYWALAAFGAFEPIAPFSLGDAAFALSVFAALASSFIVYKQMKLVRTEELENKTKL